MFGSISRCLVCGIRISLAWTTGPSQQHQERKIYSEYRHRRAASLSALRRYASAFPLVSVNPDADQNGSKAVSTTCTSLLPPGIPEGFFITQQYSVPAGGFNLSSVETTRCERSQLRPANVTVPVALMLLDPKTYPSFSKARKACRQGRILIQHSPMALFRAKRIRATVGDRIYGGSSIFHQDRLSHGSYSSRISLDNTAPPFDLPVVYEDEYLAVVNKPAGVLAHRSETSRSSRNTVKFALPYALEPPSPLLEDDDRLEQPELCHRLDKATSGLLICAKTKTALSAMSKQFEERRVQKSYTAILNGKPSLPPASVSSLQAVEMGIDVDPASSLRWYVAESFLESKVALTLWRVVRYQRSVHAKNNTVTLVELKPKTGRYHQLRRQMAWDCDCPIVGDTTYGGDAIADLKRWNRGLLLCSNRVAFLHPVLSTDSSSTEPVWVRASIELPAKFDKFLAGEERKYFYHNAVDLEQ